MGAGYHGGFGNTKGSKERSSGEKDKKIRDKENVSSDNSNKKVEDVTKIVLPQDDSQLKHIFGGRDGHFLDIPQNREKLINLANNTDYYIGKDSYGNLWHAVTNFEGQLWVRYMNGEINNGGLNKLPREWDPQTGLNNNPFKVRKK